MAAYSPSHGSAAARPFGSDQRHSGRASDIVIRSRMTQGGSRACIAAVEVI